MTPTLLLFFSLAALLCVLLSMVVIYPWLKGRTVTDNRLMAVNVQIFGERIKELKADFEIGVIDESTYQANETELKRQLLDAQTQAETYTPVGRKGRLIVMAWIPILAAIAYITTADRTSVFKLWAAQDSVGQVADDLLTGKIDTPPEWATKDSTALISAMQTNVHYHAYDPNRWMRLSELFMALEATPQALEALARAHRLDPTNDDIAMTYAQTNFFANQGAIDATAREVLNGILTRNPEHEGAMMMLAMGEARANNFTVAKAWIAKLRSNIASKSGDRSAALASLDELVKTIDAQEAKATAGVHITVGIADNLMAQLGDTEMLFVSISNVAGGPPYAVKRLSASALKSGKVNVSLSDLDAMMPVRTLSKGRETGTKLAVNARVSRGGGAISQSGDFAANPVVLGATQDQVELTISQVVP